MPGTGRGSIAPIWWSAWWTSSAPAERGVAVSADKPAHARAPAAADARARRGVPPAWTLTAALAVVYLILAPSSPDLAAASYRSYLFAHGSSMLWDNSWYGGHHLLAYS